MIILNTIFSNQANPLWRVYIHIFDIKVTILTLNHFIFILILPMLLSHLQYFYFQSNQTQMFEILKRKWYLDFIDFES